MTNSPTRLSLSKTSAASWNNFTRSCKKKHRAHPTTHTRSTSSCSHPPQRHRHHKFLRPFSTTSDRRSAPRPRNPCPRRSTRRVTAASPSSPACPRKIWTITTSSCSSSSSSNIINRAHLYRLRRRRCRFVGTRRHAPAVHRPRPLPPTTRRTPPITTMRTPHTKDRSWAKTATTPPPPAH